MSRKRHAIHVDTFPFLAVLLCAMGSLILLLLAFDRRAKVVARAKAAEYAAQANARKAKAVAVDDKEWQRKIDQLHELLVRQQLDLQNQLRATLGNKAAAEKRIRDEESAIISLRKAVGEHKSDLEKKRTELAIRRGVLAKANEQEKAAQKELERYARELDQLERTLHDLQAIKRRDKETYSLVPYHGKHGFNRKPIYVECAGYSLVFHPGERALSPLSMTPAEFLAEVVRLGGKPPTKSDPDKEPDSAYVLFLVRPNGIATYYQAQAVMKELGLDYGYEFIEADWVFDFGGEGNVTPQPWQAAGTSSKPGTVRLGPVALGTGPGGAGQGGTGNGVGSGNGTGPWNGQAGYGSGTGSGLPGTGNGTGWPNGGGSGIPGTGQGTGSGIPGTGTGWPNGSGSGIPGQGSGTGIPGAGQGNGWPNGGGSGFPGTGQGSGSGVPGAGTGWPNGGGSGIPGTGQGSGSGIPGTGNSWPNGGGGGSRIPGTGQGSGSGIPGTGTGWPNGGGGGSRVPGTGQGSGSGIPGTGQGSGSGVPGTGSGWPNGGGSGIPGTGQGSGSGVPGTGNGGGQGNQGTGQSVGNGNIASPDAVPGAQSGSNPVGNSSRPGTGNAGPWQPSSGVPGNPNSSVSQNVSAPGNPLPGTLASNSGGQNQNYQPDEADLERQRRLYTPGGNGGNSSSGSGQSIPLGQASPLNNFQKPDNKAPRPNIPLGRLIGNRDFILVLECTADAVIVQPWGTRFPLATLPREPDPNHDLVRNIQQLINRRQATVQKGETPYRPILRFKIRPDGLRAYYAAYPLLEGLRLPMVRENVDSP